MTSIQFGSRIRFDLPTNDMAVGGLVQSTRMKLAEILLFEQGLDAVSPDDVFQLTARKDLSIGGPTRFEIVCPDQHDKLLIKAARKAMKTYAFFFENGVAPAMKPLKLASCRNEQELALAMFASQKEMKQGLPARSHECNAEIATETISNLQYQEDGQPYYTVGQHTITAHNAV